MNKILHTIVEGFEEALSVTILAWMLIILTYQVILRFVFNNSNAWSEEMARYLFRWFVYLTASLAILKKAHIRVDALLSMYPKSMKRYVILLGYALFLVYCAVIAHYSYLFTLRIYHSEQVSMGLDLPMFVVMASLPVCHVLMGLRVLQRIHAILFLGEGADAFVEADMLDAEKVEKE
jgi:TRAP-type C4-dicarboxylate transport system permease small subunit